MSVIITTGATIAATNAAIAANNATQAASHVTNMPMWAALFILACNIATVGILLFGIVIPSIRDWWRSRK
ncbi:hypothetical protein DLF23_22210 [Salmonella enterica subsp. enterica serovar Newport]|nr:hypothetical protein [Salmonella enterica subsp. enterica serovar Newport]